MKIPRKLALSFLIICVSAAAMMGVFFTNITAIRNASESNNLSQDIHAKTLTLETSLLRQNSQMRGFLVTADPTYLKSYTEAESAYDAASGELEPLLTEPSLRAALLKSRAATLDWRKAWGDRLIARVKAGQRKSAEAEVRAAGKAVLTSAAVLPLRDIRDAEVALIAKNSASQQAAIAAAVKGLIIGGIVLIAIAVTLAFGLSRLIAQPVSRLTRTMGDLAAGKNHLTVPDLDRGDEIGDMARAVLIFRDAAVAKEAADQGAARAEAEQQMVVNTVSLHLSQVAEGNLTAEITRDFPNTYGAVKTNFNAAVIALRELISSVRGSTVSIRTGSVEIAQASEDLARRTESNAANLERTSAAVIQIDGRLKNTAEAANRTAERASGTMTTVADGRSTADQAVQAMSRVTADERRETVADAARMVARPTMFGIAIIALVYVPVLSLGGVEGKLFQPMAQAVMLAIVAGLVWTFTVVPALSAWLLRSPASDKDDSRHKGLIGLAERGYAPTLERALAHPKLLVIGALVMLAVTFGVFKTLGSQFTPQLDEGAITAMVYRPVGMSLERSLRIEQETERRIRAQFPQVSHTFSRIGTSEVATDPMPPNENDLYTFYTPEKDWPTGDGKPKTKAELVTGIEKIGRQVYKGQSFEFAQPIEMRFNEMLEGVRADVSVKIFGEDYDVLEQAAKQAKAILDKQPGTEHVEFETAGRPKSIVVELDHAAMLRLGLGTAEVNSAITEAIAGAEVGFIPEGEARHMIVVRMPESLRADPAAILALPLRVGDYGMVPLSRVARLRVAPKVEPILHDGGKRRAALMVTLNTSDLAGYVAKARAAVEGQVKLPPGYRIEFGGQFHQLEAAQKRLSIVVPAALVLIFLLVYAALGSVKEAAIVYTGIPFAVTGGVLALWLRGMPFSITAAIGFIALSGIAMLNGLVLVDHINALRDGRDGDPRPVDDAVREGARDRLRPVLSTALVASIGFVPMAIASGAGAEVQRPLATVVIGGIVTSTLLTLVLLPSLYRWLVRDKRSETSSEPDCPAN
ncbi:efflux RND transporter permease subunit [Sphingomonas aurantiaca]|uniref:efflux RND transporter permease subunit n=1 Tax=Sphingomonas aurantiaca TaxID=185949 RepID=UPI00335F8540